MSKKKATYEEMKKVGRSKLTSWTDLRLSAKRLRRRQQRNTKPNKEIYAKNK